MFERGLKGVDRPGVNAIRGHKSVKPVKLRSKFAALACQSLALQGPTKPPQPPQQGNDHHHNYTCNLYKDDSKNDSSNNDDNNNINYHYGNVFSEGLFCKCCRQKLCCCLSTNITKGFSLLNLPVD